MQPIVDGLREQYDGRVEFADFNARDGAEGETYFEQLSLPGHPGIVILNIDGDVLYRGFGVVEQQRLEDEIETALSES